MGSICKQDTVFGFKTHVASDGASFTLADGTEIQGLIDDQSQIDPGMELGPDPRENSAFTTLREWLPEQLLKKNAAAQIAVTCNGVSARLTNREMGIGSPFVTFEIVEV